MEPKEKFQVFTLKINEEDTSYLVSLLMARPAGEVYDLLKNLESQTKSQRDLPEDKKEFIANKMFIFKQKKESQ